MKRGDIVIAEFPHADRSPAVRRPVLVVQSDVYNQRIRNILVAVITSNLARKSDPAHLSIDVSTAGGRTTGLAVNSVVSCLNLAVLPAGDLGRKVGELAPPALQQIDACLKDALGIS